MFRTSLIAGVAGFVLLAGCSLDIGGSLFSASDRLAQVVGDDPNAVQTGAAILKDGGDAVDAATAMFFTLSVTNPSSAGVGGGGVCIVHDPAKEKSEELVFLPKATAKDSFAAPTAVRGFAAMHQDYGRLPWQKLISPAERYARTGFRMTQTLHRLLVANAAKIRLDAALAHEFLDESGNVKPVGSVLRTPDLAQTLARIRLEGPFVINKGPIADALIAYAAAQNAPLADADMSGSPVDRGTPRVVEIGGNYVFLPESRRGAGAFADRLIDGLKDKDTPMTKTELEAAIRKAAASLNLSETGFSGSATGFAVTDGDGQAVSCAVTMNAPFGSGHTARDTGIVLASANPSGHAYLAPVIASESADGSAILAGAGASGPNGNAGIANVLLQLADDETVVQAKKLKVYGTGTGDTVNMIVCSDGICSALPDPAGTGLGLTVILPAPK